MQLCWLSIGYKRYVLMSHNFCFLYCYMPLNQSINCVMANLRQSLFNVKLTIFQIFQDGESLEHCSIKFINYLEWFLIVSCYHKINSSEHLYARDVAFGILLDIPKKRVEGLGRSVKVVVELGVVQKQAEGVVGACEL